MRSLVLVTGLVLALLGVLWGVLAVAGGGRGAAASPAAPQLRPRTPAEIRAAPGPGPEIAPAAADAPAGRSVAPAARRDAPALPGVRGRLVYPANVDARDRAPLPAFVVRLTGGGRELARTTTAPGGLAAEFELEERPRAPHAIVVEPPRGWVVMPALRFAPHSARGTWDVDLEVLPVALAHARRRLADPAAPWCAAVGRVVDTAGAPVRGAAVRWTLLEPADPAPDPAVARGLRTCTVAELVPDAVWDGGPEPRGHGRLDWNTALVHAEDLARTALELTTSADGSFRAESLVPGTWRLSVEVEGFRPEERELLVRDDRRHEVVLRPAAPAGDVLVTVTSDTGSYDHCAEVVLYPTALRGEARSAVTWSGAGGARVGTARFTELPAGEYVARLACADEAPASPERARVRPPAEAHFRVRDADVGGFAFRILDAATRDPLRFDVELVLGDRRVKKLNQPSGATVLERYPLDASLEWVVRARGFLETRGGRDAFRPSVESGGEARHVAEVLLVRDLAAGREDP